MTFLYPRFPADRLPSMIGTAALGALVAGSYGALHDQVSYAISPEYFTKLKFKQFAYADFGWPPRLFASVVGFLATWWVGLLAGWFLARAGLIDVPVPARRKCLVRAFGIVFATTLLSGMAGLILGFVVTRTGDLGDWIEWEKLFDLEDLPAFVIVAYLHAAGYLGALLGLVLAVFYVRRCRARFQSGIVAI